MSWDITLGNYRLGLLDSCEISKSVDLLADTAVLVLAGAAYNQPLPIEQKIKRGDLVVVKLGYDGQLVEEFRGYVQTIATDGEDIKINCEDELFNFRKPVADKIFGATTVAQLADYLCAQIGGGYTVDCTFNISYVKYAIQKATAYDVLKKLQEETKANIYLKGKVLHIHPAYVETFGRVRYDYASNIEQADLQFKRAEDKPVEITVSTTKRDGKEMKVTVGTTGGDQVNLKVPNVASEAELRKLANEMLKRKTYHGYEGSLTGWLIPMCEPGYSVQVHDGEYPNKTGWYYCKATTTTFSSSGGVRKVELGIKLSENGTVR